MSVRVGVDVGGTFTDLASFDEGTGELRVTKALSTPQDPASGVLAVLGRARLGGLPINDLVHGTTVATNALLERKRQLPGLITTKGFRDVVFIQRMNRKHHYDLGWDKPRPFVERRHSLEVSERVDHNGNVVVPLSEEEAIAAAERLREAGIKDVAVSFLFSYVNPDHELRMREIVKQVYPEATISLSHEVYPRWREYDRTSTVLANAYLRSLVGDYLENLASGLTSSSKVQQFLVMKSNGGIEDYRSASAKPVDLTVSGPVGGVLSTMFYGRLMGRRNLISMDMGGTSFDVSLIADGEANHTVEFEIEWGLPVYAPMIDVKTIGAGGGSIAWIDKGGLLRVGPQSAGANPGPACYGRGGTAPTVTDANLVLGRLNPEFFLGGDIKLDVRAAERVLAELGEQLGLSTEEVAVSIVELVDSGMVNAIRLISIDRGLDPREFSLVSFGGAASLHAGSLARITGAREVIVPIHQGVFSAFGLMTADMRVDESVTCGFRSDLVDHRRIGDTVKTLERRALERLRLEGYADPPVIEVRAELRYLGQNYGLTIPFRAPQGSVGERELSSLLDDFETEHARLYGYDIPGEIIEFVSFTVTAIGPTAKPELPLLGVSEGQPLKQRRPVYFRGSGWVDTPVFDRVRLWAGFTVDGPAVIEESMSTTLVHPGDSILVDKYGNFVMEIER